MRDLAHELESKIQRDIRIALGREVDLAVFRNQTGVARYVDATTGREFRVPYGLGKGGSDLVGMLAMKVTLYGVEVTLSRWIALEVKQPGKYPTEDQKRFLRLVRRYGGFGAVVRSVDEAMAALGRARAGECE
ncbi:MAG TPA: hypothetical protein VFD92_04915 [Candidatus Binatia bacterium]|nr:hypothetical protein [Candidatus Binatia bacterium]